MGKVLYWSGGTGVKKGHSFQSHAGTRRRTVGAGRRTAMLDAVTYAATRIVGVTDWRVGIQELLNRLGRATDVCRVTLFEFHERADASR